MKSTPKGMRLHIGLFGRRNVGKSSILNALTRQQVSIVSDIPGTTTDPVEKPMELLPLGPVLFIDTAGLDDVGILGEMRAEKTRLIFERTDLGIVVVQGDGWGEYEENILAELSKRSAPAIIVFNKIDIAPPPSEIVQYLQSRKLTVVETVAPRGRGLNELYKALIQTAPEDFLNAATILGDLINSGDLVVLVVPIDLEAPRGRLILPQVQTIRDILDHNSYCLVVKENELGNALSRLKDPPALVVTDSQAFSKVVQVVPADIPLTSFSILFARWKGDLKEFVRGAKAISKLQKGNRILVLEACTHHPISDDIGRVKIPRWIRQYAGVDLEFIHRQGHDFPQDLSTFHLVIHCGACMLNRREVISRIMRCREARVPITNYGVAIAYCLGILDRALSPFREF
jgi:[FeFe] hydrogenase H-cluster maturation GTPase HydF